MAKNITTQYHNSLIVNEITGKVEGGVFGVGVGVAPPGDHSPPTSGGKKNSRRGQKGRKVVRR